MAKRKRAEEAHDQPAEPQVDVAASEVVSDVPAAPLVSEEVVAAPSLEEVAQPTVVEPEYDPQTGFYDEDDVEEERLPPVNPDISSDPEATVAAVLLAIGRVYNDAGVVSMALTKHLRTTAGEPELHGFLQRMQSAIGDFRHAVNSVEQSTSEYLRDAIVKGVS